MGFFLFQACLGLGFFLNFNFFLVRARVGYSHLLTADVHSRWDTLLCTLAATTET